MVIVSSVRQWKRGVRRPARGQAGVEELRSALQKRPSSREAVGVCTSETNFLC